MNPTTVENVLHIVTSAPVTKELADMLEPHGIILTNLAHEKDKHILTEKNLVQAILPVLIKAWKTTQNPDHPVIKKLVSGLFKVGMSEIVDKDTLKRCRDEAKASINANGLLVTKSQDMAMRVTDSLEF